LTDPLSLPFFDADHRTIAALVSAFAGDAVGPRAKAADESNDPVAAAREFIRLAAERDILRLFVPSSGGDAARRRPGSSGPVGGLSLRTLCLARERIAAASAFADSVLAVSGLGSYPLSLSADEAIATRYLAPATTGAAIGAFALTEPEAGSDPSAIQTTAKSDGHSYVLTGSKTLISNAGLATFYVVFANTEPQGGAKRLSAFVVDADTPGLRVARQLELAAPHPIGDLALEECRVPAAQRLGAAGEGLKIALKTLDFFRSSVGAAACGLAACALEEATARAINRRQFGSRIADFQLTKAALADMATELDAARLLVYRAAWMKDNGVERITTEASMAKLFATEAAQRIVDRAVQIHGGIGVQRGTVVERLYREVRALRIYEGTSEIQRLIIGDRVINDRESR
jgi:acyl-CoA dehydrogenase